MSQKDPQRLCDTLSDNKKAAGLVNPSRRLKTQRHRWRDQFYSRGQRGAVLLWGQCQRCGLVACLSRRDAIEPCPGSTWLVVGAPAHAGQVGRVQLRVADAPTLRPAVWLAAWAEARRRDRRGMRQFNREDKGRR